MACAQCACDSVAYTPVVLESTRDPDIAHLPLWHAPHCTPHHLTHTRLLRKVLESLQSAVAGVERRGRQLHGARGETALRGAIVEHLSPWHVRVHSSLLHWIAFGQRTAGLHGVAPAASDHPYPLLHALRHARACSHAHRLERVRATASTRRGRGETLKPIFSCIRVASSKELMVFAHSSLPHEDGECTFITLGRQELRGGM
jgi:hypothetical protein